jgi:tryptophanase
MAALAVGLREVLDEDYLRYRIASVRYLYEILDRAGVPLMRPAGGHAVYIDAGALYPQIKPWEFPGVALCNELYLEGGIRGVEIGTLMFGKPDPAGGRDQCSALELVRLAFPRRTYTQSHVDWLGEIILEVAARRDKVRGYGIKRQGPILRAVTAELQPLA